jgi:L-ascorbate metabolism protein UlaG (beta-lactamase superfamily)
MRAPLHLETHGRSSNVALTQAMDAPTQRAAERSGSVLFIGNATLLIRFASLTILTDPNFVGRNAEVPIGFGLTAVRTTEPALGADELSQPDVVLLSHDHGDHFDDVAADWLDASVPIITCPAAAGTMAHKGFGSVRALHTWESTELERDGTRVRVTAVPARHAPGPLAFVLPDVMGSVLEFWRDRRPSGAGQGGDEGERPPDLVVYISGDTVLHDRLAEIAERFPRIDLAFIHLGGMRVMGMALTLGARHGVELVNLLRPRMTIPIHYNDYGPGGSPLAEFAALVRNAGLSHRVRYLRHGESWPLRVMTRATQPRG